MVPYQNVVNIRLGRQIKKKTKISNISISHSGKMVGFLDEMSPKISSGDQNLEENKCL